jgi:hypothetical protein
MHESVKAHRDAQFIISTHSPICSGTRARRSSRSTTRICGKSPGKEPHPCKSCAASSMIVTDSSRNCSPRRHRCFPARRRRLDRIGPKKHGRRAAGSGAGSRPRHRLNRLAPALGRRWHHRGPPVVERSNLHAACAAPPLARGVAGGIRGIRGAGAPGASGSRVFNFDGHSGPARCSCVSSGRRIRSFFPAPRPDESTPGLTFVWLQW